MYQESAMNIIRDWCLMVQTQDHTGLFLTPLFSCDPPNSSAIVYGFLASELVDREEALVAQRCPTKLKDNSSSQHDETLQKSYRLIP
jgi:hypothetical protein